MALPVTFGTLPGGTGVTQPLALFDTQFAALGALVFIPCAAAGQNNILLTPAANTPALTGYTTTSPVFGFYAAQTNNTAVTVSIAGFGARNAYKNNGLTAVAANDLQAGGLYYVAFNPSLNSGAGGFVLLNQAPPTGTGGQVQGTGKNLVCGNANASTPTTQYIITEDSVCVSDGSANYSTALAVNVTISSAASGANGLDTGAIAAATWYYAHTIYNPTTQTAAGLLSASATAPTLPTGFTQWARRGTVRTDGSKNFLRVLQDGRKVQYNLLATTNTTLAQAIANGAAGTYSANSPVLAAVSITSVVPPTASEINVLAATHWKNGTLSDVLVAPSTQWGGTNNGPNGSAGQIWPYWGDGAANAGANIWMLIETTTIAWASDQAGAAVACMGYVDNL